MPIDNKALVLASGSSYRKALLERLHLKFTSKSPDIDESRQPKEPAAQLVTRLAQAKAQAVADHYSKALIIGSDQVAVLGDEILGKPGSEERAVIQLNKCNGQNVVFHTGLCLFDTETNQQQLEDVLFEVKFRQLSQEQIIRYIKTEQPYDSAGSFKAEGLGITLFESLKGTDPTALIGLPLIALTTMLNNAGIQVP